MNEADLNVLGVLRQVVLFSRLGIIGLKSIVNISGHAVLHVGLMTFHEISVRGDND